MNEEDHVLVDDAEVVEIWYRPTLTWLSIEETAKAGSAVDGFGTFV